MLKMSSMDRIWRRYSDAELKETVFNALKENVNYKESNILGVPASFLDDKVFNQDAHFLKDAPFISTLVQNPNHIGCHTVGTSESYFSGTQKIEKQLLEICAIDILKAEPDSYDGYVAAGGTEANLQAIWMYRNYFMREYNATAAEICILCSEDSHYSMDKASDVFAVDVIKIPVEDASRSLTHNKLNPVLDSAIQDGKKYFIVIANMMTTMFGSIDDVSLLTSALKERSVNFRLHIDGAFGGFYYPFAYEDVLFSFENADVSSFTLDAHKMAQAPYGTGIFICRKGLIGYTNTRQASYVEGEDYTLSGSRSGANAVAAWMILAKNGPYGWKEKIFILQKRTQWMCDQLNELGVRYYRHPYSNIVTLRASEVATEVAKQFGLVPDNHTAPNWYKMVIMEHVTVEKLLPLVKALKETNTVAELS